MKKKYESKEWKLYLDCFESYFKMAISISVIFIIILFYFYSQNRAMIKYMIIVYIIAELLPFDLYLSAIQIFYEIRKGKTIQKTITVTEIRFADTLVVWRNASEDRTFKYYLIDENGNEYLLSIPRGNMLGFELKMEMFINQEIRICCYPKSGFILTLQSDSFQISYGTFTMQLPRKGHRR